jgi:hypothetical protein
MFKYVICFNIGRQAYCQVLSKCNKKAVTYYDIFRTVLQQSRFPYSPSLGTGYGCGLPLMVNCRPVSDMEVRCIWIDISAFCRDMRPHSCSSCFILRGAKKYFTFRLGITWFDAGWTPEMIGSYDEEAHLLNLEYEIELFCVPRNKCECKKTVTWHAVKYGPTRKSCPTAGSVLCCTIGFWTADLYL